LEAHVVSLSSPPRPDLFIPQSFDQYTQENHDTWRRLFARIRPRWEQHANARFLEGIGHLCLPADRIPRLEEVNEFLCPLTGFRARAVAGYVPAFVFFDCLRRREFPTTVTIRDAARLDYLPEPDIFHDVAGHVPMHTDPAFAAALVRFGDCALAAAESAASIRDPQARAERLGSRIRAMARFFWFTIEFGLMRAGDRLKACGSGLLSSFGELGHAIESPRVRRRPLELERVVNQPFDIDHYQPLLFIVESFDHLFEEVDRLERWMRAGRLDQVAPGEPEVNAADLESFLAAAVAH
jgi:phenylalanine-4-hydroxylase